MIFCLSLNSLTAVSCCLQSSLRLSASIHFLPFASLSASFSLASFVKTFCLYSCICTSLSDKRSSVITYLSISSTLSNCSFLTASSSCFLSSSLSLFPTARLSFNVLSAAFMPARRSSAFFLSSSALLMASRIAFASLDMSSIAFLASSQLSKLNFPIPLRDTSFSVILMLSDCFSSKSLLILFSSSSISFPEAFCILSSAFLSLSHSFFNEFSTPVILTSLSFTAFAMPVNASTCSSRLSVLLPYMSAIS